MSKTVKVLIDEHESRVARRDELDQAWRRNLNDASDRTNPRKLFDASNAKKANEAGLFAELASHEDALAEVEHVNTKEFIAANRAALEEVTPIQQRLNSLKQQVAQTESELAAAIQRAQPEVDRVATEKRRVETYVSDQRRRNAQILQVMMDYGVQAA